jgi:hypothetical protein
MDSGLGSRVKVQQPDFDSKAATYLIDGFDGKFGN